MRDASARAVAAFFAERDQIVRDHEAHVARVDELQPCATCGSPSHVLELARNVVAARPASGICADHCGQMAPCTERRIAVAFLALVEAVAPVLSAGVSENAAQEAVARVRAEMHLPAHSHPEPGPNDCVGCDLLRRLSGTTLMELLS